jgi:hypothetical protein
MQRHLQAWDSRIESKGVPQQEIGKSLLPWKAKIFLSFGRTLLARKLTTPLFFLFTREGT